MIGDPGLGRTSFSNLPVFISFIDRLHFSTLNICLFNLILIFVEEPQDFAINWAGLHQLENSVSVTNQFIFECKNILYN